MQLAESQFIRKMIESRVNEVKVANTNFENVSNKRKKRQRISAASENEDKLLTVQYEKDYAEGFINKLSERLDETTFHNVLQILQKFETSSESVKEIYADIEIILKEHPDLKREFLGFLEPSQTLECEKLMEYFQISNMKEFICKLMLHFKKQPQLFKKILDKLCHISEQQYVQFDSIWESLAPFLQKNAVLMQQFFKLFPFECPPDKYFSSDDVWEDVNIDNDITDEETFDSSHFNESFPVEPKTCIYDCKTKISSSYCPICNVKYINGRMYIANSKMLRPANIIFNSADEKEHTKRLTGKSDYFIPLTSRSVRIHKRADTCGKELTEGRLSPFLLGTESEEEIGDDVQQRNNKRKSKRGLKIRFGTRKKKSINIFPSDQTQTDDTAASNDDGSCDDTSKEDNGYNSCEETAFKRSAVESNSNFPAKEIVALEDIEFNISSNALAASDSNSDISRLTEEQTKFFVNTRLNLI